jgi:integrase/recombinase XerD
MSRSIDPSCRCLPLQEWPASDQRLWERAVLQLDFEDEDRRAAAAWRPTTTQTNREGYGRWLNYLARAGQLDGAPADRATPTRVREYLAELRSQGISVRTQCNRISQLLSVMLAFAPEVDWRWLKRRFNRLDALAREHAQPAAPVLLSGDILDRTFAALNAFELVGEFSHADAITYRNWLMMAMLILVPIRRQNFAELAIGRQLKRIGEDWRIEISPDESKAGTPIILPVPRALAAHVEHYLRDVRPRLLRGKDNDRLWITTKHGAITGHSIFVAVTNFTRKMFGTAISPHRFRHTAATSVVIAAPERVEAARALLSHRDSAMTENHYIIAASVAVSRQHSALIAKLRRELPGAKKATRQPRRVPPQATTHRTAGKGS